MVICEICKKEVKNIGYHVSAHNMTSKIYYDIFLDGPKFCKVCGIETSFRSINEDYKEFCSTKCSMNDSEIKEKYKNSIIKKYGVDNVSKCEDVKLKRKNTCLEIYVETHPLKSRKIRDKLEQTCLKKYGFKNVFQSEDIKNKSRQSSFKKYGVDIASKTIEIQNKIKKTCLERYGVECFLQSDEIKDKLKSTCLRKYGVDNSFKSEVIKEKIKKTMFRKYNVEHALDSEEIKNNMKIKCKERYGVEFFSQIHIPIETLIKLDDKDYMLSEIKNCSVQILADKLSVSTHTILKRLRKHGIDVSNKTYIEDQIENMLKGFNVNYIRNDRQQLAPLELDFFIPEYNLGIEVHGIYWHSQHNYGKDKHLIKYRLAKEKNIKLLQFFETEICNKSNIVKSIIGNNLNKNKVIYARNTEIKEVDNILIKDFLKDNHIQGSIYSSINLGLFYKDGIVSIICFSKSRFNKKYDYEMTRFCNKAGLTVIGGAGKLFKYFNKLYFNNSVISYCDLRFFDGNMYDKLNFKLDAISKPNYFYVISNKLHSRIAWQKHKLNRKLKFFDPNKTEYENMLLNGYDRIWDCGNMIFSYNKKN